MQLNCKVINKVATPPPFSRLSPFLVKCLVLPLTDSIFGGSYLLPPLKSFNKEGGVSNYDVRNVTENAVQNFQRIHSKQEGKEKK